MKGYKPLTRGQHIPTYRLKTQKLKHVNYNKNSLMSINIISVPYVPVAHCYSAIMPAVDDESASLVAMVMGTVSSFPEVISSPLVVISVF